MGRVFKEEILHILLVYMDDVLVHSNSIEEHIQRLEITFHQHNSKLEPKKCMLFQSSVRFRDHVLTPEGIKTDPQKIEPVQDWPQQQDLIHGFCIVL